MNLENAKIVVIGGGGLIGSHTVDLLLKEPVREVVVFDNFSRGRTENLRLAMQDPRLRIYSAGGDILQTDILKAALHGADGVFHFAALWLLQCHEFPRSAFEVNVRGTFNVMEACTRAGVKRLVYSSSASVYGDAIKEPMDEDHPLNNRSFYGATKICGEAMLRSFHYRYALNFIGLRYMNVYGPRQEYRGGYVSVIMHMLETIERGDGPLILGDGTEAFDFIAVEDCALANICALRADIADQFYNIGTGTRTTLRQLAEMLVELTGCRMPIQYGPRSHASPVRSRIGSPHRAREELGFSASIKLHDGLKRLIQWRAEHKTAAQRSSPDEPGAPR